MSELLKNESGEFVFDALRTLLDSELVQSHKEITCCAREKNTCVDMFSGEANEAERRTN